MLFLYDQVTYICDNKTNQFQKDTKNLMLNLSYFMDVTLWQQKMQEAN